MYARARTGRAKGCVGIEGRGSAGPASIRSALEPIQGLGRQNLSVSARSAARGRTLGETRGQSPGPSPYLSAANAKRLSGASGERRYRRPSSPLPALRGERQGEGPGEFPLRRRDLRLARRAKAGFKIKLITNSAFRKENVRASVFAKPAGASRPFAPARLRRLVEVLRDQVRAADRRPGPPRRLAMRGGGRGRSNRVRECVPRARAPCSIAGARKRYRCSPRRLSPRRWMQLPRRARRR